MIETCSNQLELWGDFSKAKCQLDTLSSCQSGGLMEVGLFCFHDPQVQWVARLSITPSREQAPKNVCVCIVHPHTPVGISINTLMLSVAVSNTVLKPCSKVCRSYTWIPVSPAGNWAWAPEVAARSSCLCRPISQSTPMVLSVDSHGLTGRWPGFPDSPAARSLSCGIPRDPSMNTQGSQTTCLLASPAWYSLWSHPDLQPAHRWPIPLVTIALPFPCLFLPKTLWSFCLDPSAFGSSPKHPLTGPVPSLSACIPKSSSNPVRVRPLNLKTWLRWPGGAGNVERPKVSPVVAMRKAEAGYLFGFLHLLAP